jgi:hypothetical protein
LPANGITAVLIAIFLAFAAVFEGLNRLRAAFIFLTKTPCNRNLAVTKDSYDCLKVGAGRKVFVLFRCSRKLRGRTNRVLPAPRITTTAIRKE